MGEFAVYENLAQVFTGHHRVGQGALGGDGGHSGDRVWGVVSAHAYWVSRCRCACCARWLQSSCRSPHLAGCHTVPSSLAAGGTLSDKSEPDIGYVDRYIEQAEMYSAGPDPDQTACYSGRD